MFESCSRKTFLASLFFTPDVDTDIIKLIPTENIIPTIVNSVEMTDLSITTSHKNVGNNIDITADKTRTITIFMIAIFSNIRS